MTQIESFFIGCLVGWLLTVVLSKRSDSEPQQTPETTQQFIEYQQQQNIIRDLQLQQQRQETELLMIAKEKIDAQSLLNNRMNLMK